MRLLPIERLGRCEIAGALKQERGMPKDIREVLLHGRPELPSQINRWVDHAPSGGVLSQGAIRGSDRVAQREFSFGGHIAGIKSDYDIGAQARWFFLPRVSAELAYTRDTEFKTDTWTARLAARF